jgi:hypothetical protein
MIPAATTKLSRLEMQTGLACKRKEKRMRSKIRRILRTLGSSHPMNTAALL